MPERAASAFATHWGDGQAWEDLPQRSRDLMVEKIRMIEAGEPNVYGDSYGFSEPGRLSKINRACACGGRGAIPHECWQKSIGRWNGAWVATRPVLL